MPLSFKPMLARAVEDLNSLRFPLLVSPKLDGIRCCIVNGEAVTRNLKLIPNTHIRASLKGLPPFDGELIVEAPTAADVWNKTSSGVMSQDGTPNFAFYVFDMISSPSLPFEERLKWVMDRAKLLRKSHPFLVALPHNYVHSLHELMQYEEAFTREGYEGAMAGGAARRAVLGLEGAAPPGADIDYFFRSAAQFETWKLAMAEIPGARIHVGKDHVIEFEFGDVFVQGIKGRYFQSPIALIEDFDFTLCQFVMAGPHLLYLGSTAIADAEAKILVCADTKAPVAMIRRIMKYKAEGFRISDAEIKKLLRATVKNPDSIDRELVVADYVRETKPVTHKDVAFA